MVGLRIDNLQASRGDVKIYSISIILRQIQVIIILIFFVTKLDLPNLCSP